MSSAVKRVSTRPRKNSVVQNLLNVLPETGLESTSTASSTSSSAVSTPSSVTPQIKEKHSIGTGPTTRPTFLSDLISFRWMTNPISSLKLILLVFAAYIIHAVLYPGEANPVSHLLFISYPLPPLADESTPRYDKGLRHDGAFLVFYIIVFSFIRQVVTMYGVKPLAIKLGLRGRSKLERFMEQGYALFYFVGSSSIGLYVMAGQKTWWYQTEHYWIGYPHWRMTGALKYYYLLQFAYWCQQMLVLVLRIEKPRSDFFELVIHHLVTLWLVGWSYSLSLTMVGTAIFVSMDIPDVCLALSKCLNYLDLKRTSEASFVFFLVVWHYMRHYLNIRVLLSVWREFHHVPLENRSWVAPESWPGMWYMPIGAYYSPTVMPDWIQQQVFLPIFLLQLVNLFWSFLIWRILYRMITGTGLVDTREEGEDQEGEPVVAVKGGDKAKKLLGNGSATGQAVLNGDAKKRRK